MPINWPWRHIPHRDTDTREDLRTAVVLARLEMVTQRFEEVADRLETQATTPEEKPE